MLQGKRGLVFGITNKNSIGWSVAKAWKAHGADVGIVFQSERFRNRIFELIDSDDNWDSKNTFIAPCDVSSDEQIADCKKKFVSFFDTDSVDMVMHSIAYAPKECLHGNVSQVTRDSFLTTMDISVFSFISIAHEFRPLLASNGGGSLQCLTYDAVNRVVRGYGLMGPAKAALETCVRYLAEEYGSEGIKVNALSAGPLNTLSARGLPNFHDMRSKAKLGSPLQRNIDPDDVGDLSVFLASDMSRSMTGQTIFVDAGHSIVKQ